jgi:hypothetical protein
LRLLVPVCPAVPPGHAPRRRPRRKSVSARRSTCWDHSPIRPNRSGNSWEWEPGRSGHSSPGPSPSAGWSEPSSCIPRMASTRSVRPA